MSHMRLPLVVAVATAATALLVFGAAPAAASNPVVFTATDSTADTPGAPDIASVTVSDTTQGLITFQMTFVPGTEQLGSDSFGIYIDSDQNPTTGDLTGAGADYLLEYDSSGLGLFKWDGKSSYALVQSSSIQGSFSGDSQYFVIAASELGITDGFNFNAAAAVGSDPAAGAQVDFLPENGTNLHYSIQSKVAIKLSLSDSEYTIPHAGKLFTHALLVKRSDTGVPVGSDVTVRCSLTVRGRKVPLVAGRVMSVPWYSGGSKVVPACTWRIPRSTAGATLVGKETVTLGGSSVAKAFTYRVRK